jgi:hypothetical protein
MTSRIYTIDLEKVVELCSVEVATLLQVFRASGLSVDLRNQILTMGQEGRSSEEIGYITGISEAEVITVLNSIKLQSKAPASEVSTVIEESRLDGMVLRKDESISLMSPVVERPTKGMKQGTKTWPRGDKCQGELIIDELHRLVTMQEANGSQTTGLWKDG